jgi:cytochrome c peroxidase
MTGTYVWVGVTILVGVLVAETGAVELSPKEQLGKLLFFDKTLSQNKNQSCATCHAPDVGWTGPDEEINKHGGVYEASVPGRFGNRKPPSAAYATPSPVLRYEARGGGTFVGGSFWDGRATGSRLGSPVAEQAQGPFLNPLEHAIPGAADLVRRVAAAPYADLFRQVWGAAAFDDTNKAYDYIGLSIAAFEASREVNAFSSKYDAYLAGKATLTAREKRGLTLFEGAGACAKCHTTRPGPKGEPPMLTDFTYDNIGMPRNPDNPFYYNKTINPLGGAWVDLGLGGFLATTKEFKQYARQGMGKHKVPTLRNVDKRPSERFVKAYGHNGYFKSLQEIVHFYSTRDALPILTDDGQKPSVDGWPIAEVPMNLRSEDMGNLRLSPQDEDDIVAFLKTLTDGYFQPEAPKIP